jgi:hypothetical protein
MMDDGDKHNLDEQFSLLDAQSRKRRRVGLILTAVLVGITGSLVLQLARDIVAKQAQVRQAEQSRGELDERLRTEQEKVDKASRTREKLEAEIRQLEAMKKSYQDRILSDKDAHNMGSPPATLNGKPLQPTPSSTSNGGLKDPVESQSAPPRQTADMQADMPPPEEALLIEESGKAPPGFFIKPKVNVTPAVGASGREIFKVELETDVPEGKRADVERVSYHLSPKYYLRNVIEGGDAPTFQAKFNVFACESTVLVRVKLRDGTALAFDFDWCHHENWPDRKKEVVIVTSENEKTPTNPPVVASPSPSKSIPIPPIVTTPR